MGEQGAGGGAGRIDVQISSLTGLAKALRDEAELNLTPSILRAAHTLDPGFVAVKEVPGYAEWEATRAQYVDGRDFSISLLEQCRAATLILAAVADKIAGRYRDSDQFAKATVDDVNKAFVEVYRSHGGPDAAGAGAA